MKPEVKVSFQGEPVVEIPLQKCDKCGFTTWYDTILEKWRVQ